VSRRNEPTDFIGDIVVTVLKWTFIAVVAVISFIVAVIFAHYKVSPQKKLLKLQPPHFWGGWPDPLTCFLCNQFNEFDAEMCLSCGVLLTVVPKGKVFLTIGTYRLSVSRCQQIAPCDAWIKKLIGSEIENRLTINC